MYTLCTTEKSALQQRQFEQCFLQQLLESDYDTITISDLCRRTGLSRKIFYRLFEKKADVLYSLIDHTLLECESFVPDDSVESGGLHRFFAFWQEQKDLLDALLKHQNSSLLTDRAIRHIIAEDSDIMHSFGADSSKYGTETIIFFTSGIFTLVLRWHQQGYYYSIDEMSELLMRLLTTLPIKNPLLRDPYTKL